MNIYDILVDRAIEQYERLGMVCGDEEIVFAISSDVRMAIQTNNDAYLRAETENHETFYGVPIYTIPEAATNVLAPVVCGRNYHVGMEIGDLILYENHIYRLNDNASFIDTGLTIPYEELDGEDIFEFADDVVQTAEYAAAVERVTDVFVDAGAALNTATITTTNTGNIFEDYANTFTHANYMNFWPTYTATVTVQNDRETLSKRKTREKEEELSVGDTKLLDEFLGSFVKR